MSTGWTAPGSTGSTHSAEAPPAATAPTRATAPAAPGPLQRELVARRPLFPLRPLSLGEILSAAMNIYRVQPRLTLGLAAIVHGVSFAIITLLTSASLIPFLGGVQNSLESADPQPVSIGVGDLLSTAGSMLVTNLLTLIASSIVALALSRITMTAAVEAPVRREDALAAVRRHWLRGTCATLLISLASLAVFLGCVLLGALPLLIAQRPTWWTIIPVLLGLVIGLLLTVWVWSRLLFPLPAMVVEGMGPIAALRRSWRLTAGRRQWRVLGIAVLVVILYTLAVQVIAGIFSTIGTIAYVAVLLLSSFTLAWLGVMILTVLTMLGSYIATVLLAPFLAASTVALYADLRMRHEAWDVQLQQATRANRAHEAAP